ncbi:MAG: hypothetical protein Q8M13_17380 [Phenylobacterium sp.]|nr:hypothetical protein [Phenylobacterium sp.]
MKTRTPHLAQNLWGMTAPESAVRSQVAGSPSVSSKSLRSTDMPRLNAEPVRVWQAVQ